MKTKRLVQTLSVSGVALFMMVANASAATISFTTNNANTGFNGGVTNTLNSSSGAAATLTFVDNTVSGVGTPSFVNYGDFLLTCNTCTTQTVGTTSATFSAFSFKLVLTDNTDGSSGFFTGSSSGGSIFSDQSNISIAWTPFQLGPGTLNATSGNFGNTAFFIQTPTQIVAPNSGTPPGDTTVQGQVTSAATAPEPATFGLIGVALLGAGMFRRKVSRS